MKKEVIKGPRVQGCRGGPMCPPKELSEDGPDVLYVDEAVPRPEGLSAFGGPQGFMEVLRES
jgi:hypothetical protein